jgi:hypothetical protein
MALAKEWKFYSCIVNGTTSGLYPSCTSLRKYIPARVISFTSHKPQAKSGELVASLRLAMYCRQEFTLVKPNQAQFTHGSLC